MGTLQLRPEFFDVYLELAIDFGLPLRLSGASSERLIGFPARRLATEEGVLFPDHFVTVTGGNGVGSRRAIEKVLFDLRPGVTEIYLHPPPTPPSCGPSPPTGPTGSTTCTCWCTTPPSRARLERSGVQLIGYRELREAPARRRLSGRRSARLRRDSEHARHRAAGRGVEAQRTEPADLGVAVAGHHQVLAHLAQQAQPDAAVAERRVGAGGPEPRRPG